MGSGKDPPRWHEAGDAPQEGQTVDTGGDALLADGLPRRLKPPLPHPRPMRALVPLLAALLLAPLAAGVGTCVQGHCIEATGSSGGSCEQGAGYAGNEVTKRGRDAHTGESFVGFFSGCYGYEPQGGRVEGQQTSGGFGTADGPAGRHHVFLVWSSVQEPEGDSCSMTLYRLDESGWTVTQLGCPLGPAPRTPRVLP